MKPIMLKIKGINSFLDEQAIDFRLLCKNGLFGIFGPTGSGKSTVIDAMTIALYGELARFEGSKSKQFINTLTDTAWVYFEFSLSLNGKEECYAVERSFKRAGESQRVVKSRLIRKTGDEQDILCDKPRTINNEIEELLGLSYKDFTRAVVLPQGKFSQFLLLANMERKDMLERLFDLDRYGERLVTLVRGENKKLKDKIAMLDMKIGNLSNISKESVEEKKSSLKGLEADKLEKEEILISKKLSHEKIARLKENFDKLNLYKSELDLLEKEKPGIDVLRKKLSGAEKALQILPVYKEHGGTVELRDKAKLEIDALAPELLSVSDLLKQANDKFDFLEKQRTEKLPELTGRKVQLEQAVEIQKRVTLLEAETIALRKEYAAKREEQLVNAEKLSRDKKLLEDFEKKLGEIQRLKIENIVSPEYRKSIDNGKELSARQREQHASLEKIVNEKAAFTLQLKEEQKRQVTLKDSVSKAKISIENLEKSLHNLGLEPPVSAESINILKEKKIKAESIVENKAKEKARYDELARSAEKAGDEARELILEIEAYKKQLEELANETERLNKAIEAERKRSLAHELTGELNEGEPCPVCGSVHHPFPAPLPENNFLEEITAKLSVLKEEEKKINEKLNGLSGSLQMKAGLIQEIDRQLKEIGDEIPKFNIAVEKAKLNEAESEILSQEEIIKKWTSEKLDFDNRLKDERRAMEVALSSFKLCEGHLESVTKLMEIKRNEESALRQDIDITKGELEKVIAKTGQVDFVSEKTIIDKKDNIIEQLNADESTINKNAEGLRSVISTLDKEILEASSILQAITVSGKEKAGRLKEYKDDLEKLSGDGEPSKLLTQTDEKIKELTEEAEKARLVFNQAKEKWDKLNEKRASLQNTYETLNSICKKRSIELESLISEHGFDSMEEFGSSIIDKDEMLGIKQRIAGFDNKISNAASKINEIAGAIANQDTDDIGERLLKLAKDIEISTEELSRLNETIILLKKEIEEAMKSLEAAQSMIAERGVIEKRNFHVEEILKLVEGKKMVDFIATRHLKYITADASERLRKMSSGRYSIELDDTDFVIRDDFSGGLRRSPKTLSGGETFMASLCLALALSGKVQLKSSSSLEFFFLDEGFGSLDGELLNTVMDVLLKLKTQNINVGVISHVEEIKNIIPDRLIISPPVYGYSGSKVKMD